MSQPWLKKQLNALELYTVDVIYGRRAGAGPALYGAFLQLLSWLWSAAAQAKLWLYRHRILHDHPLGCLVVVVGNLTAGGTVTFVPVEAGIAGDEYFEVSAGVEPGDTVVAGPYTAIRQLRAGDRVRPLRSTPPT